MDIAAYFWILCKYSTGNQIALPCTGCVLALEMCYFYIFLPFVKVGYFFFVFCFHYFCLPTKWITLMLFVCGNMNPWITYDSSHKELINAFMFHIYGNVWNIYVVLFCFLDTCWINAAHTPCIHPHSLAGLPFVD